MTLLCKAFLPESFKAIEVQRRPRCQLLLKSKNGPSREVSSLIDYMPAGPLRSRDVEIEHSCRVDCAYSISHRRVLGGARQDEPSLTFVQAGSCNRVTAKLRTFPAALSGTVCSETTWVGQQVCKSSQRRASLGFCS